MAVIVEPRSLTSGPGELWAGQVGATEPEDTDITLEVDETDVADEWEGLGATNDGITLNIAMEYFSLEVDQALDTVERRATSRDVSVATNLAEVTLHNLRNTQNGGTVVEGPGYRSYEPATGRDATQPTYSAYILDCFGPDNQRRRCVIRRCINTAEVSSSYAKDAQTLYPIELHGHFVANRVPPYRVVDEFSLAS
ncbi:hypothetical protein ACWFMI_23530 [Nocardiopsis terrae]|uniref:hypothetical protein n=1 Tax=Streptomyces sp. NPDC057554 TaxID=3350538 RepID=UPI0036A9BD29